MIADSQHFPLQDIAHFELSFMDTSYASQMFCHNDSFSCQVGMLSCRTSLVDVAPKILASATYAGPTSWRCIFPVLGCMEYHQRMALPLVVAFVFLFQYKFRVYPGNEKPRQIFPWVLSISGIITSACRSGLWINEECGRMWPGQDHVFSVPEASPLMLQLTHVFQRRRF